MVSLMRRGSGTRWTIRPAVAAALAALLLGVSACGSDGGGDGGGGGDDSIADLDSVSDEQAQEMATLAFGSSDVAIEDLDPVVQEALRRAALELTPEQQDKAFECWEATTCEVGDGDITLGIAEGFGGNLWRKTAKMEIILQALTYPSIGKIIFTDAVARYARALRPA